MISDYFTKTATVKRLVKREGSNIQDYATVATITCSIHSVSVDPSLQANGAFFDTFKLYASPTADLKTGDKLECEGSTYTVKGVRPTNYEGSEAVAHLYALIVKS